MTPRYFWILSSWNRPGGRFIILSSSCWWWSCWSDGGEFGLRAAAASKSSAEERDLYRIWPFPAAAVAGAFRDCASCIGSSSPSSAPRSLSACYACARARACTHRNRRGEGGSPESSAGGIERRGSDGTVSDRDNADSDRRRPIRASAEGVKKKSSGAISPSTGILERERD